MRRLQLDFHRSRALPWSWVLRDERPDHPDRPAEVHRQNHRRNEQPPGRHTSRVEARHPGASRTARPTDDPGCAGPAHRGPEPAPWAELFATLEAADNKDVALLTCPRNPQGNTEDSGRSAIGGHAGYHKRLEEGGALRQVASRSTISPKNPRKRRFASHSSRTGEADVVVHRLIVLENIGRWAGQGDRYRPGHRQPGLQSCRPLPADQKLQEIRLRAAHVADIQAAPTAASKSCHRPRKATRGLSVTSRYKAKLPLDREIYDAAADQQFVAGARRIRPDPGQGHPAHPLTRSRSPCAAAMPRSAVSSRPRRLMYPPQPRRLEPATQEISEAQVDARIPYPFIWRTSDGHARLFWTVFFGSAVVLAVIPEFWPKEGGDAVAPVVRPATAPAVQVAQVTPPSAGNTGPAPRWRHAYGSGDRASAAPEPRSCATADAPAAETKRRSTLRAKTCSCRPRSRPPHRRHRRPHRQRRPPAVQIHGKTGRQHHAESLSPPRRAGLRGRRRREP